MASSKIKPKSIYTARTDYVNRSKKENECFQELNVPIQSIETALLLLYSSEDLVLISVFKNLTEFVRKQEGNVAELKRHNLLDVLLEKSFFMEYENVLVKRFALYLLTTIIESTNTLQDLDIEKTMQILELSLEFYIKETDDFCIEYLSVTVNKCLDDPHVLNSILNKYDFLEKYFLMMGKSQNPDVIWHSFEALHKMLQMLDVERMDIFTCCQHFPIDRVICDLMSEYAEIRIAALKVIKDLIVDISDKTPFADLSRCIFTMTQLTDLFCSSAMEEVGMDAVDVLATAMRTEKMSQILFEYNLFDKIVQDIEVHALVYPLRVKCKVLAIFAENAKFLPYLQRLYAAHMTELFLECLLHAGLEGPAAHILLGLNRLMKFNDAANKIVDTSEYNILPKLLNIMSNKDMAIKTREQAVELVGNMLTFAYHNVAEQLLQMKIAEVMSKILPQGLSVLSVDFMLPMLNVIEQLAQNNEYRTYLGSVPTLITNLAITLKNAFSTAVLVNNIFRCLCTLVDEEPVRTALLQHFLTASVKRGLKSLSNLVKTSVTNFIMQTTRFPEMLREYIDEGVLEVLIMNQKHSMCVSTWGPAIESILSKCPSLKFCIRNHLSFTDSTFGHDFLVSKKKFDDFRVLLSILIEEVSPLMPIIVVNFERISNPPEYVVEVPVDFFPAEERASNCYGWCYCRKPGDPQLPLILDRLNEELERNGLLLNPPKVQRCIDFENVARRAKVIAAIVANCMSENLKSLDINAVEECSTNIVKCHLHDLSQSLHCNFLPIGSVRSGCQFERAILFKALADQIGLPCTLQRSVDTRLLFNEVPLPVEMDEDIHCDRKSMQFMPWRMLRPTHIVDLMYNIGDLYPIQSREALQYLRLY